MAESTFLANAQFTKVIGELYVYPHNLFAGADNVGCIHNVSDLSTLYQDIDGTVPAALGDQVRRIKNLAGNVDYDWIHTDGTSPATLAVDERGNYYLQFTNSGFDMAASGRGLLSASKSAVVITSLDLAGINTYRCALRINTESNVERYSIVTAATAANISVRSRRATADNLAERVVQRKSGLVTYASRINWAAGLCETRDYPDDYQSLQLPSSGQTSASASTSITLGHYASTQFAAMRYYGGIIISGDDVHIDADNLLDWHVAQQK